MPRCFYRAFFAPGMFHCPGVAGRADRNREDRIAQLNRDPAFNEPLGRMGGNMVADTPIGLISRAGMMAWSGLGIHQGHVAADRWSGRAETARAILTGQEEAAATEPGQNGRTPCWRGRGRSASDPANRHRIAYPPF